MHAQPTYEDLAISMDLAITALIIIGFAVAVLPLILSAVPSVISAAPGVLSVLPLVPLRRRGHENTIAVCELHRGLYLGTRAPARAVMSTCMHLGTRAPAVTLGESEREGDRRVGIATSEVEEVFGAVIGNQRSISMCHR